MNIPYDTKVISEFHTALFVRMRVRVYTYTRTRNLTMQSLTPQSNQSFFKLA